MGAGYSGTPLAKKLSIKPGADLTLLNAPDELTQWLAPMPEAVVSRGDLRAGADVVVAFFDREAALRKRLPAMLRTIFPDGGLWVAWPKKASGVPTDITEDTVRRMGLAAGVVDNKVCAISEVWSGLRLVHRVENRR
jgi:hypothetical protein